MANPYAFRVRMPLTGGEVSTTVNEDKFRAALEQRLPWDHRNRACAFNPECPDCISNEEATTYLAQIPFKAGP